MIARMNLTPRSILPNLEILTFATWQRDEPSAPHEIADGRALEDIGVNMGGMMDAVTRLTREELPTPREHIEGLFGLGVIRVNTDSFPLATHICRMYCEGPLQTRFVHSVSGRVVDNVVHHWDLVEVPNLIFGAHNHIVVHRPPGIWLQPLVVFALFQLYPIFYVIWERHMAASTHGRTELSVHVRLHHADGSPVTESHAEHNEIFDAMKHALAINFGGSWPEHIHIKMADSDHRCSACGELLDPSGPDLAARIANLSV
jgi:hypothetical protein